MENNSSEKKRIENNLAELEKQLSKELVNLRALGREANKNLVGACFRAGNNFMRITGLLDGGDLLTINVKFCTSRFGDFELSRITTDSKSYSSITKILDKGYIEIEEEAFFNRLSAIEKQATQNEFKIKSFR